MVNKPETKILLVIEEPQLFSLLEEMLKTTGYTLIASPSLANARRYLEHSSPNLLIMTQDLNENEGDGLEFAAQALKHNPTLPILLIIKKDSPEILRRAIQVGISDYLSLPVRAEDFLKSVHACLEKAQRSLDYVLLETRRNTAGLKRQINELETLERLGCSITSTLDLDSVLSAVVDASVELTGADEGSLLLLDEASGELYIRAARNFQEEFVHTFRLPIQDSLAGRVMQTGQPVLLDESTPQKIKTAYLVQSLIYVPLQIHNHVFGVLGIDNRTNRLPFTEHHVRLLSTIGEFAVIAIENARLYANTDIERKKYETLLTHIQDGVIVLDNNQRLILINQTAHDAFGITENHIAGKTVREVFKNIELLELIDTSGKSLSNRTQIALEDGRIFSAQLTAIPEIGQAMTMHDITYLKKLDQIKSDFVNTVSHDLRSPLTAILGYNELIEHVGPVTSLQHDFIQRVQSSVQDITNLVDDLLNLGRIEAGFDTRKEPLKLEQIIRYSADSYKKQIAERNQHLEINIPDGFPIVLANPIQIHELVDNLLDNANKYTPPGGVITITGEVEINQVILQFHDTGIGIPPHDLPFIFDKFYRASNASSESTGTGLGLSIVKSITDNHQGRIWVESVVGKGTTFTVVLPLVGNSPKTSASE